MLPRFSRVFQFNCRWLRWRMRQPEGHVRPVVDETIAKIMACGTSLMGGMRWCCPEEGCGHEKTVAFTCKSRSCPHCGVKACTLWIQAMLARLPDTPFQHITFTMPREFWLIVKHNRWLLSEMSRAAADVILEVCRQAGITPGIFTAIHTWGRDLQWHPHIHLSTTAGGITEADSWRNHHFAYVQLEPMWRYRIITLLRENFWRLDMPETLAAEGRSRSSWSRFLDVHYRRKWNVHVSEILDNATHVAMYMGWYLKKSPVSLNRLEHYAGSDDITLRYKSHRTKQQEALTMDSDEFFERFQHHVPDKYTNHLRYYGFLSPSKRDLLEKVYALTQTAAKEAKRVTWRAMYRKLLKVDPLKCLLCGAEMRFAGMKRGLRLAELMVCRERLARMEPC